jgi:hypothetical protein
MVIQATTIKERLEPLAHARNCLTLVSVTNEAPGQRLECSLREYR